MNPYMECVPDEYKDLPFDVAPRGNMLRVVPIDAEKAGLQTKSLLDHDANTGKIGAYLVLDVSEGYDHPSGSGRVTLPYEAGQIVLVERKHILWEMFGRKQISFVSATYVLGVATKRDK